MNRFGDRITVSLFGESHGLGVGCVVDGIPPGTPIDLEAVQADLDARRPGTGPLVSQRKERDLVEVLSGTLHGVATGAPIALWIPNEDAQGHPYAEQGHRARPGHADFTSHVWSGGHHDMRGGGHNSGRLTAPLVAAGALMRPLLPGIEVRAHLHQVGGLAGPRLRSAAAMRPAARSPVRTAHESLERAFIERIEEARRGRDSVGGVVAFAADGVPAGLGEPFFGGLESRLAQMLFAVPAVKAVGFGEGFAAAAMAGSQHNDALVPAPASAAQAATSAASGAVGPANRSADGAAVPAPAAGIATRTNHAGGILGGRATGMPIWGEVAVKPASSIALAQDTVDLATGQAARLELTGRHDPCIAVRAVPVVEACVRLVLADALLGHRGAPLGRPAGGRA